MLQAALNRPGYLHADVWTRCPWPLPRWTALWSSDPMLVEIRMRWKDGFVLWLLFTNLVCALKNSWSEKYGNKHYLMDLVMQTGHWLFLSELLYEHQFQIKRKTGLIYNSECKTRKLKKKGKKDTIKNLIDKVSIVCMVHFLLASQDFINIHSTSSLNTMLM